MPADAGTCTHTAAVQRSGQARSEGERGGSAARDEKAQVVIHSWGEDVEWASMLEASIAVIWDAM